jgi:thiol-disulfide isomerase/thioredoxin
VKREAILTAERRLWKELGGSDESWTRRLNAKSAPMADSASRQAADFKAVARAVPDFSLKDLQGRTWTPAQWKGKTVVAVVWATWCAPCLHEMPHFEKLAARLKDRSDVLFMSLNTDDNTGVVEPFMKKNGYTVPVLLAKHFAEDLMPYFAIPRTWIFRDGVLVSESIGFGPDPETWANNILAQFK